VKFFAILREIFGAKEKEVELKSGSDILELLNIICDSPKSREKIFGNSSEPKASIQILKNGRSIRSLDGIHTKLEEGDSITILPLVFGG